MYGFSEKQRKSEFLGDDEPNYVSYAVWETKADFEAFEEQFEGMPARYDALFALSLPPAASNHRIECRRRVSRLWTMESVLESLRRPALEYVVTLSIVPESGALNVP